MNKTLSQLKRDIQPYTEIMHTEYLEKHLYEDTLRPLSDSIHMTKVYRVSGKNASGFYIQGPRDIKINSQGTYIPWPTSKDLIYEGNTFTILSRHPQNGEVSSKNTYKIINQPTTRIIYT